MNINDLIQKKIWIAPLAGFTDYVYREILKEWGADVLVSEMVSADGLVYSPERSLPYAEFSEFQRPFGIQLFGSDPLIMAKASEIILKLKPDFIDVNMGCPVKKVVKRGAGSALMQTLQLAVKMVKEMKKVISNQIPLTVKIRAGWDEASINAQTFALSMQDSGADAIIIHPRTRSQQFSGNSDWSIIQKCKNELAIPVIGNGDIKSVEDALRMYETTNCDSIMIGRGIMGNPWLPNQIKYFISTGECKEITNKMRLQVIKKQYQMLSLRKREEITVKEMRAHISFYTKGLRGGSHIRNMINQERDMGRILTILEDFFS